MIRANQWLLTDCRHLTPWGKQPMACQIEAGRF